MGEAGAVITLNSTVMKKEEILEVLKNCDIQSYYIYSGDILSVICKVITYKELKVLAKDIIDIVEYNGYIRVAIELS